MQSVPDSSPGPLPLVIGVTGHRDLRPADHPVLERTVRRAIEELRAQCPHTPLIVLSALAEGADRLVARAALDLGLSLIVPLPMPQAEYEKDFDKLGSLDDFRSIPGQAKWQFVVAEAEIQVLYRQSNLKHRWFKSGSSGFSPALMSPTGSINLHGLSGSWG
jgi:hypothetical protein